jgi:hypothetical protein
MASVVGDQASALEAASRYRDTRALDARHHGEELLGQQEAVRIHPVACHQQPATARNAEPEMQAWSRALIMRSR